MTPKSFYDVRFGVAPGGARKDAHHIRGSLDQAMVALDLEFEDSGNAWLLFQSGADLALDVYQRGQRVSSIDLHPFVTVRVAGYPDMAFGGPSCSTAYVVGTDDPDKVKTVLAELGDRMFAGDLDGAVKVTVDWDKARVPLLVGDRAEEGDYVMLGDGPLDDLDELDGLDEDELEDELIDRGYVEYGDHDFDA